MELTFLGGCSSKVGYYKAQFFSGRIKQEDMVTKKQTKQIMNHV